MSLLYDIRLTITYSYDSPAVAHRGLLRIMPRSGRQQQLISGFVATDPAPDFRRDGTDFFGNATVDVVHDQPLSDVAFRFTGRVRRLRDAPEMDFSCPYSQLAGQVAAVRSLAPDAPHHFLPASDRVALVPDITAFGRDFLHPDMPVLDALKSISHGLFEHMQFDPEATEVTTPPREAFANRRGVCQDFAHILIAALRGNGIPAGYVSGFLRTIPPPGQARLEGADAMHAWVRVWCGDDIGWVEIDPTNDTLVDKDHIAVAYGRDYGDVAPVKGSHRSVGGHDTHHEVDVVEVPHEG